MREYELEVLERYETGVKGTRRIRGAFFCDTEEGARLLKETNISEKRALSMYLVQSRLEAAGMLVDTPVFTKDGEILAVSRDGTKYMMKKWYSGRECDMKRESELARAAANLAVLHRKLNQESAVVLNGEAEGLSVRRSPLEEIRRHNRELKKVRTFIRKRVAKNEFEFLFLNSFEKMYAMAEAVEKQLEESGCMELYRQSVEKGRLTHGDYNYHNLLILPGGTAVTGFEHMGINIQVHDLYYFIRKAMEKFHWKENTGRIILEAYEKERELENAERKYIGLSLAYPEKFWKTASSYYHSNKAWLPEKSVEKLETVVQQWDEKYRFLKNIFALKLF